jgi:HSP20 family molecular chaperone IbpA
LNYWNWDWDLTLIPEFTNYNIQKYWSKTTDENGIVSFKSELTLPGISKDMIDVFVEDGYLNIKIVKDENNKKSFKLNLPKDVDTETLTAKLDLGILTLQLNQKTKEEKTNTKIKWLN